MTCRDPAERPTIAESLSIFRDIISKLEPADLLQNIRMKIDIPEERTVQVAPAVPPLPVKTSFFKSCFGW